MKARVYLFIVALVAVFTFAGCKKNNDEPAIDNTAKVVGEWHCATEEYDVDVYVAFSAEGTFDEYQRIGEGRYRHYNGTWTLNKDILSGVYSDGESWTTDYTVKYNKIADPKQISLTSTDNVGIYTATSIPDAVVDQATEATTVRSVAIEKFL